MRSIFGAVGELRLAGGCGGWPPRPILPSGFLVTPELSAMGGTTIFHTKPNLHAPCGPETLPINSSLAYSHIREQNMGSVTVKEAAERFGISEARVRQLLRSGRMAGHRAGPREWRVAFPWHVEPGRRGPDFGGTRKTRDVAR